MTAEPLAIEVELSRQALVAQPEGQLVYLLLRLHAPQGGQSQRRPLNLSLVIDRSTSMAGGRLQAVKEAALAIIEHLTPEDVLSLVTFSDRADVLWPAGRLQNRSGLQNRIRTINTSGGTEIYPALTAAVEEMGRLPLDAYTNHLVLLTDGNTYGDTKECLKLASEAAERGIDISAFGIGSDWNDQFLDRLAGFSGGQSAHIGAPSQVMESLRRRVDGLSATYAHSLQWIDDFPPNVAVKAAFKVAPFAQALALEGQNCRMGPLETRTPLAVLLELLVEAPEAGTHVTLPFRIQADIPSRRISKHLFGREAQLEVVAQAADELPPKSVAEAVRALTLYRLNERAWQEVEQGGLGAATVHLTHLSERLDEVGQAALAAQARAEKERLLSRGELSAEGRKGLKYGTRALMTGSMAPPEDLA